MISVALAAFRGEKYIEQQLKSIITQLSEHDEIVVSDDEPGGETQRIVTRLAQVYPNIRYIPGKGQGLIKNFENALENCRGDILFLSDQDDVWLPEKVSACVEKLRGGALLVLHDCSETDEQLRVVCPSYFRQRGSGTGIAKNIVKNSYMGCCMAFRAQLLERALPFPDGIPMHDQWLGLLAEKEGRVELLDKPLICHRLHADNMTGGKTSLKKKIIWRVRLIRLLQGRHGNRRTAG